jgi:hypothetical protein
MTKRQKRWVYSPSKASKPKVPEDVKKDVDEKAAGLVEAVLKPKHVKPPPEDAHFNYIVDIFTKWYRNYFYFCSKYHCPGPTAISPYFEDKFGRLEYVGEGRFNVSFMRHTGKWVEIYTGLTTEESLAAIQNDPWFQP